MPTDPTPAERSAAMDEVTGLAEEMGLYDAPDPTPERETPWLDEAIEAGWRSWVKFDDAERGIRDAAPIIEAAVRADEREKIAREIEGQAALYGRLRGDYIASIEQLTFAAHIVRSLGRG